MDSLNDPTLVQRASGERTGVGSRVSGGQGRADYVGVESLVNNPNDQDGGQFSGYFGRKPSSMAK